MTGKRSEPENRPTAMLRLLGLSLRAGKLQLGAGPVLRALDREHPGVVILARDAGGDVARRVKRALGSSRLDETTFTADQLASAFGRQQLAVVSVHDRSFVSGLARFVDRQV